MAENIQKELLELLNKPQKDRDMQWESDFLSKLPHCKVTILNKAPQAGPDQFPYMFVDIKEESSESAIHLIKWISENGIGLAVNPTKTYPDFVLTFGMVWNYFQSGKFLENPIGSMQAEATASANENLFYTGSPSESYLPKPIRSILKEFLAQQGVMAPKIIMISKDQVNFDLCFSIESFGSPDSKEHEGILQALSWFLPAHYSLAFVTEEGLPSFEDL